MMSWVATRGFAASCEGAASAMSWECLATPRCATWRRHYPSIKGVDGDRKPRGNQRAIGAKRSTHMHGGGSRCETVRKAQWKSRWSNAGFRLAWNVNGQDLQSGW